MAVIFTTETGECYEVALTEEMKDYLWGEIHVTLYNCEPIKYHDRKLKGITIERLNTLLEG